MWKRVCGFEWGEELMGSLEEYSGTIQAIVAILNLFLVSWFSVYSYYLSKKNRSMELYLNLQQEIKACIGEVNECIKYFSEKQQTTSEYLYNLSNSTASDSRDHEDLANQVISNLSKIILKLRTIIILVEDLHVFMDCKDKNIIQNISILNLFKLSLIREHPIMKYENCVNGPETIWLDAEYFTLQAFDNTMPILENLENILNRSKETKALT